MSFSCNRCGQTISINPYSLSATCRNCGQEQPMRTVGQANAQPQAQPQQAPIVNINVYIGNQQQTTQQPTTQQSHHNYMNGIDSQWPRSRNPLHDGRDAFGQSAIERYAPHLNEPRGLFLGLGNLSHQVYYTNSTTAPVQGVILPPQHVLSPPHVLPPQLYLSGNFW